MKNLFILVLVMIVVACQPSRTSRKYNSKDDTALQEIALEASKTVASHIVVKNDLGKFIKVSIDPDFVDVLEIGQPVVISRTYIDNGLDSVEFFGELTDEMPRDYSSSDDEEFIYIVEYYVMTLVSK
jgi:hypothetical protein